MANIRLKEGKEYESCIAKFRVEKQISVMGLAKMCGCYWGDIDRLESGETGPFCEMAVEADGVRYEKGSVRPCVQIASCVLDKSLVKMFPAYESELSVIEGVGDEIGGFDDEYLGVISEERSRCMGELWEWMDKNLTPRENRVMRQFYGDGMEFKEISDDFTVTEHRIRQIHAKALRKIKPKLFGSDLRDDLEEVLKGF